MHQLYVKAWEIFKGRPCEDLHAEIQAWASVKAMPFFDTVFVYGDIVPDWRGDDPLPSLWLAHDFPVFQLFCGPKLEQLGPGVGRYILHLLQVSPLDIITPDIFVDAIIERFHWMGWPDEREVEKEEWEDGYTGPKKADIDAMFPAWTRGLWEHPGVPDLPKEFKYLLELDSLIHGVEWDWRDNRYSELHPAAEEGEHLCGRQAIIFSNPELYISALDEYLEMAVNGVGICEDVYTLIHKDPTPEQLAGSFRVFDALLQIIPLLNRLLMDISTNGKDFLE